MKITTHIKSIFVAGLTIFVLSGCSSGSSASGLGLGISGFWSGTLFLNGAPFTGFSMSLIQILDDADDAFSSSQLEGTFNSNDACIGGGTIAGSLNANNLNIQITTPTGTLNMSGTAGNSTMGGSWNNEGEIAGEGEEGAISCNLGGTWTAGR